jgi:hypothetical protein
MAGNWAVDRSSAGMELHNQGAYAVDCKHEHAHRPLLSLAQAVEACRSLSKPPNELRSNVHSRSIEAT